MSSPLEFKHPFQVNHYKDLYVFSLQIKMYVNDIYAKTVLKHSNNYSNVLCALPNNSVNAFLAGFATFFARLTGFVRNYLLEIQGLLTYINGNYFVFSVFPVFKCLS